MKQQTAIMQQTIAQTIIITGVGLHSGQQVVMRLEPAPVNQGVVFFREDFMPPVALPIAFDAIHDTVMSTNLKVGEAQVSTIEHLMSAFAACGIDNISVYLQTAEIPIMDGSGLEFVKAIAKAGVQQQHATKQFIQILKEVRVTDGDKWASLSPATTDAPFAMQFEIDFNHPAFDVTQNKAQFVLSAQNYCQSVGQARTFGFLKDLELLHQNNLALGASMQNAIAIDEHGVANPEGLRLPNEFVLHKLLDALGDLYVAGHAILGEYAAYKSGHGLNNKLLRALFVDKTAYKFVTFNENVTSFIDYNLPSFVQ